MRKYWVDYLRVIAILAVITTHVSAHYFKRFLEIERIDWWASNILNTASRFAVPLFIMISGSVLLGRSYSVGEFYKKRAIRLLPAIFFWNLFYLVFNLYKDKNINVFVWMLKFGWFEQGEMETHLWYLSMFCCLMLFVPYINKFLNGDKPTFKDLKILLCVIFFIFLLNGISTTADNVLHIKIDWFKIFPWYMAYFIGGYYVDKYGMNLTISNSLIFLIITLLVFIGAAINYLLANFYGIIDSLALRNDGPFVFIITILIFLFGKRNSHLFKSNEIIARMSEASFGIYLVHPVFIFFLKKVLPSFNSNALYYIPLTVSLTYILSFYLIMFLRKSSFFKILC